MANRQGIRARVRGNAHLRSRRAEFRRSRSRYFASLNKKKKKEEEEEEKGKKKGSSIAEASREIVAGAIRAKLRFRFGESSMFQNFPITAQSDDKSREWILTFSICNISFRCTGRKGVK